MNRFRSHGILHVLVTDSKRKGAGGKSLIPKSSTKPIGHGAQDRQDKELILTVGGKGFLFPERFRGSGGGNDGSGINTQRKRVKSGSQRSGDPFEFLQRHLRNVGN
jgi:hypothetical protein